MSDGNFRALDHAIGGAKQPVALGDFNDAAAAEKVGMDWANSREAEGVYVVRTAA